MKRTCGLIIMDGFAFGQDIKGNAVKAQGTPNIKKLMADYPNVSIGASGLDVGLPEGQMGNSEVGHLNIGAGRTVYQDITRIDKSIKDGDFFENPSFIKAMDNVNKYNSKLHLVGLLSDGGVHSHINHLYALLKMAKDRGVKNVFVHCLMDGRDVSPTSGADFIQALQQKMSETGVGKVGSVIGRYYYMDRDNRWERVEKGYNCMTAGAAERTADPVKFLRDLYAKGITDEFATPVCVTENGEYKAGVDTNDSVIFFNFRSDRARQVTRAYISESFNEFERAKGYQKVCYVGLTQYDAAFEGLETAYAPKQLANTLGEYLAASGKSQLRIAETEKYAHVTFFFNGGVETPNKNEERILVPSPKVATYDLKPEMSAYEVTDKAVASIESGKFDCIILNFANCDMVGHTGDIDATIKAVSVVDECVQKVVASIQSTGGAALITSDHGNADQLLMPDGSPCTAHTTNAVPFILADEQKRKVLLRPDGKLCDIAPTLLEVMGMKAPAEMEGQSLIKN